MEVNFIDILKQKKQAVWPVIEKYLSQLTAFPSYCQIASKYSSLSDFHQGIVEEYPQRQGKYLRPSLVLLTSQAMGVSEKTALQTAAAMQVSEDWILNHDDIEDNSLQRRGKPALHQIYGKELAINAGDGLHVLMWKILLDNLKIAGPEIGRKIMEEFYQMLSRTILGQTVEVKWAKENKLDLTDEDILFIMESKTGYYSIAGPMRLGAILAGAGEKQLGDIYEFGKTLGRSFQIIDDLLDLTSDFKGQKKQTGNDVYEGKRTIMLMHLLRTIKGKPNFVPMSVGASLGKDRVRVEKILKKNREEKTAEEVSWIIEKMKEYGSLEYGKKLAEKYAQEALKIFESKLKFLKESPAREQLKSGIDFILKREF